MMIRVLNPKGRCPILSDRSLPPNFAVTATNCNVTSNAIKALKATSPDAHDPANSAWLTLRKHGSYWLYWTSIIDHVRGQVAGTDRVFYTDGTYPKTTDTTMMAANGTPAGYNQSAPLSLTPPTGTLSNNFAGSGTGEISEYINYIYTTVAKFADGSEQESSPKASFDSPYSIQSGQYVYLTGMNRTTTRENATVTYFYRFYRLVGTNAGTANYFLVKMRPNAADATAVWDVPVTGLTSVYDHNTAKDGLWPTSGLGEVIPTEGWDPAPDTMTGIIQVANGTYAGIYNSQEICFSVPFYYYAWPQTYRLKTQHDLVALGTHGEYIYALTTAYPEIVYGADPTSYNQVSLQYNQACVAKRSVVSTPFGLIYASPDGLFLLKGTTGQLITENLIDKTAWQALTPANIIGFYYDGCYYGFFNGTLTGFILDLTKLSWVDISLTNQYVHGGYVDAPNDKLYLIIDDATNEYTIEAFAQHASNYLTYTWKSKVFETPRMTSFTCGRVVGTFTTLTFKLYADGVLKQTTTVTSDAPFRLASGFRANSWQVEVSATGTNAVESIELAQSLGELISMREGA